MLYQLPLQQAEDVRRRLLGIMLNFPEADFLLPITRCWNSSKQKFYFVPRRLLSPTPAAAAVAEEWQLDK